MSDTSRTPKKQAPLADNFARGPARYKDGSLVEPYPVTKL